MQKLRNIYYVLRHGDNVYLKNNGARLYPKKDSPEIKLTREGSKQAKDAGKFLKSQKIDLIFSSDFFRTRQTAKIAAKELGIGEVVFDKRLRDINLGVYHGLKKEEFYKRFWPPSRERFSKTPHGGESWLACRKRLVSFLKEVDRKHKGEKILLVGHGDPFWLLEGWVKKWPRGKMLKERTASYIKVGEVRELYGGA